MIEDKSLMGYVIENNIPHSPICTLIQLLNGKSSALRLTQRLIVRVRIEVASARNSMDMGRDLSVSYGR